MLALCYCMAAIVASIAPPNKDYLGLEGEEEEA